VETEGKIENPREGTYLKARVASEKANERKEFSERE